MVLFGATHWQGRTLTILIPNFASKFIPIIASVSEHQPTTWAGYYFDLEALIILMPIGFFYTLLNPTPAKIFIALYGVMSVYSANVMIRLLLILAPACSILAAIGISEVLTLFMNSLHACKFRPAKPLPVEEEEEEEEARGRTKKRKNAPPVSSERDSPQTEKKGGMKVTMVTAVLGIVVIWMMLS